MTDPDQPFDLRCRRPTGISGRYSADSPVLNKVSGDRFTRTFRPSPPGFGAEVYGYSWIVEDPVVTWARCSATITGDVRFFGGSRPATSVHIVVGWQSGPTTATVTFSGPDGPGVHAPAEPVGGAVEHQGGPWRHGVRGRGGVGPAAR